MHTHSLPLVPYLDHTNIGTALAPPWMGCLQQGITAAMTGFMHPVPNFIDSAISWQGRKYVARLGFGSIHGFSPPCRKLQGQPFSLHLRTKSQRRTPILCCAGAAPESSDQPYLKDLQVPSEWVAPPAAAQEAEWLRGALHQWLDDEYCPEPANEEISRRCARVYYYCLMEEQVDIGDILMQMVRDLETFSFKDSFHGAFTSANAAIDLITKRMGTLENSQQHQQFES